MVKKMSEHVDVDASGIIDGGSKMEEIEYQLWSKILETASGDLTRAELLSYDKSIGIFTHQSSI
jgi:altronate dehydratase large subunit